MELSPQSLVLTNPNIQASKEPTRRIAIFEHIFKGSSYEGLPNFNPLNIPLYTKRLIWDYDTRSGRLGKAVKSGYTFAERVDLPYPDKLTMAIEMMDLISSPEVVPYRAVNDLLHDGKRLGGVALKVVSWLPEQSVQKIVSSSPISVSLDNKNKLFSVTTAKVIGILDKHGNPKAYILYQNGSKPRKRVEELVRRTSPALGGELTPVPSRS